MLANSNSMPNCIFIITFHISRSVVSHLLGKMIRDGLVDLSITSDQEVRSLYWPPSAALMQIRLNIMDDVDR